MADPEYFTLAELRERPGMDNVTKYPEDRCLAAAAAITDIIEEAVSTSFVARTRTETLDGNGRSRLVLRESYVRSVTACTVDGTSVLADLATPRGSVLRFAVETQLFTVGLDNVVVTYEAGYQHDPADAAVVPPAIKEAAIDATRWRLIERAGTSATDPRRTSITAEGTTTNLATAGADRWTGYPDVDAVILLWQKKLYVPRTA